MIHYTNNLLKLKKWIEAEGVTVNLFAILPDNIVGRCDYDTATIFLHAPTSKMALMALAHEAGHWICFKRRGMIEGRLRREQYAYLYGWAIIKKLNLMVNKSEWIEEEYRNMALYIK